MQNIFAWIALTTFVILAISALLFALSRLVERLQTLWYESMRASQTDAVKRIGHLMVTERYWMSEDEDIMKFLEILGSSLRDTGNYRMSDIRDAWRLLQR